MCAACEEEEHGCGAYAPVVRRRLGFEVMRAYCSVMACSDVCRWWEGGRDEA